MPARCCVNGCRASSTENAPVALHRFPRNEHFCQAWREILQLGSIKLAAARVCGNHFSVSQYDNYEVKTLKANAFPDLLLPTKRDVTRSNLYTKRAVLKRLYPGYICADLQKRGRSPRNPQTFRLSNKENCTIENLPDVCNVSRPSFPRTYYNHQVKKNTHLVEHGQSGTEPVVDQAVDASKLYFCASIFEDIGREETVASNESEASEPTETTDIAHSTGSKISRFVMFKGVFNVDGLTPKHLKHLSGLTKSQFEFIYELCVEGQIEWPYYGLSLKEQLLLTFIKYRKGYEFLTLAILFNMKETSARDIFVFWTNLLHNRVEAIDFWKLGSRQDGEYIAILDCTEIPMEKPEAPDMQQVTFSKYKNTNTFKVLVAIDEQGTILFVSDAYGGSVSDNKIVELSGIVNKFNEGDHILADRGFEQTDILSAKGVILNRPPNKKGEQLSEKDVFRTRAVASRRIDVERVIGYAKTYKIISQKVPHAMFPFMDKIIKVLFKLTNFRPPICKIAKDRYKRK